MTRHLADRYLDWDYIARCHEVGLTRFKTALDAVMAELDDLIPDGRNVFAHTMAGGIPKAKVVLAIVNRIQWSWRATYVVAVADRKRSREACLQKL